MYDNRIKAWNVLFEMPVSEYLDFAKSILDKNEFQRKKIRDSNKVYRLLKDDLKRGCIMPPMVLALKSDINVTEEDIKENSINIIKENIKSLLIIDGLQRTNVLISIDEFLNGDVAQNTGFYNNDIRIEIYIGISRTGILYRMLTLNTGQTRMSLRHQIEIMYSDLIDQDRLGDILLIKEAGTNEKIDLGKYVFRDVVDGFNSFLTRNEFPLKREDLLEQIEGLEELSKEKFEDDLFFKFVKLYDKFMRRMDYYFKSFDYDNDEVIDKLTELSKNYNINIPDGIAEDLKDDNSTEKIKYRIFDMHKIFNKSIAITGFGAAIGKLIDSKALDSEKIEDIIDEIVIKNYLCFVEFYFFLQLIKNFAKNIGVEHRRYYCLLFKELFNRHSDSFVLIDSAVLSAKFAYDSFKY
ncbi:hypothetical protein [Desulfotruncus arcticus]|uniref:hypothetical protein n=1 Tax=Desulfotruncus arcticus TaxID=341036 RepID=UPI0010421095|nr:hypothetical protein [Desulfotruncus arcticus]